MRIWTKPFLWLFLGVAVALALLVILPLPTWLFWTPSVIALVICLVGGWILRSRLLRVGFFLQAAIVAWGLLHLLLEIGSSSFITSFITSPAYLVLSGVMALLNVVVFVCLSYGIAPWRAPRDLWLTILQVVLALGGTAFLITRSFLVILIFSYQNLIIELALSLACDFFIVFLLLLRGVCWKRAPVAIALMFAPHLIQILTFAQSLLAFSFLSGSYNITVVRVFLYVARASFPLFYLGMVMLVQTDRVREERLPDPVLPPIPVPGPL